MPHPEREQAPAVTVKKTAGSHLDPAVVGCQACEAKPKPRWDLQGRVAALRCRRGGRAWRTDHARSARPGLRPAGSDTPGCGCPAIVGNGPEQILRRLPPHAAGGMVGPLDGRERVRQLPAGFLGRTNEAWYRPISWRILMFFVMSPCLETCSERTRRTSRRLSSRPVSGRRERSLQCGRGSTLRRNVGKVNSPR